MCVCFFFSRFVWTNGYVPQKPDGESMFSIIFPIKRYCIPTISTILRMPNSCERINQRMPNFQKATEVSASDDELKVPFWEWVYSFKDLNMHVYIYIHIIIIIIFFYCNILFSANEHSYGMGSSHQQVQPRSSDLPSSLRAFRKWQVAVSPSAAYCGLLRPYPHGILPHLCDAKSV
jgi:hypothetical protein